jgi:hypothetical protein
VTRARPLRLAALLVALVAASSSLALAQPPFATVDSIAVRYFAAETGGPARPRFITSRQVDFEARLLSLEEDPQGAVQARHVREAIESHIADDVLASLPLDPEPDPATLQRVGELLRAGLEQRASGKAAFDQAAKQDGIAPDEVDAFIRREARAAIYLDRTTPLLSYTEDQLREAYRTTSHPFRQRRFDDVRQDLARWLVIERFREAEQAYLQTARARLTIVYTGPQL